MADSTYEGWSNYETWAVKLWMDNEEPSYRHYQEVTRDALDNPPIGNEFISAERKLVHELADAIKAEHEEAMPELEGFVSDLLNAAFSEIDWTEIAESLIRDANEQRAYEASA